MKLEKQIEKLEEIDYLELFNFIYNDYDGLFLLCNYVKLYQVNGYKEIKKFLKEFYKNLDNSLVEVTYILQQPEYMYGHEPTSHLKFLQEELKKYQKTLLKNAFIDYLTEHKNYEGITCEGKEIFMPGKYMFFIYKKNNPFHNYDIHSFFDSELNLIKDLHQEDKKDILYSVEHYKYHYLSQLDSILKFKVSKKNKSKWG